MYTYIRLRSIVLEYRPYHPLLQYGLRIKGLKERGQYYPILPYKHFLTWLSPKIRKVEIPDQVLARLHHTTTYLHLELNDNERPELRCFLSYERKNLFVIFFIRVYSKYIYQFRLSNVLLSKSGASGIRTTLLTLTAESEKKKKSQVITKNLKSNGTNENDSPVVGSIVFLECPCGKKYKQDKKDWYLRHMTHCKKYAQINSIEIEEISCDDEKIVTVK